MDYVVFVSLSSPFIFKVLTTPKPQIFQFLTFLRLLTFPKCLLFKNFRKITQKILTHLLKQ